jgi:hypothetical protein
MCKGKDAVVPVGCSALSLNSLFCCIVMCFEVFFDLWHEFC